MHRVLHAGLSCRGTSCNNPTATALQCSLRVREKRAASDSPWATGGVCLTGDPQAPSPWERLKVIPQAAKGLWLWPPFSAAFLSSSISVSEGCSGLGTRQHHHGIPVPPQSSPSASSDVKPGEGGGTSMSQAGCEDGGGERVQAEERPWHGTRTRSIPRSLSPGW